MAELTRALTVLALVGGLVGCGAAAGGATGAQSNEQTAPAPSTPVQKATASPANPDSEILAEFNARLDNYVKVQRALSKKVPLEETENPADIASRQDVLAGQLKHIRSDAKPGDIFTPQVAALFKRLMHPELKGAEGRETKQEIKEENPVVELKVNATYPSSQPLTTVPGNLLANLPQLPKDVEYRFIGRHLILRDVDANIIVDYIFNAIG